MAPSVVGVSDGASTAAANPTVALSTTAVAGDVLILVSFNNTTGTGMTVPTAVSGLGGTWTRIPSTQAAYMDSIWIGTGVTGTGTITATAAAVAAGRVLRVHHLRGVTSDVQWSRRDTVYSMRATSNQIALAYGTGTTTVGSGLPTANLKPGAAAWALQSEILMGTRRANTGYIVPRPVVDFLIGSTSGGMLVVGTPVSGSSITARNLAGTTSSESRNGISATRATVNQSVAGDPALFGTRSSKAVASAADPIIYRSATIVYPGPAVGEGQTYTASGYINSVNARTGRFWIQWKDYNGSAVGTPIVGSTVSLPANTWTRLSLVGVVAPALANLVDIGIEVTDGVNTDVYYLDGWLFETGSTLGTYIDAYLAPPSGKINLFQGGPDAGRSSVNDDDFPTIQITAPPTPSPSIVSITTGSITTVNPTVTLGTTPGPNDILIVVDTRGQTNDPQSSGMSGCGATWSYVGGGQNYVAYWIGVGATAAGVITATSSSSSTGRALRVFHLRGVTKDTYVQRNYTNYPVMATPNQIVIAACFSQSSTQDPILSTSPPNMWITDTEVAFTTSRRFNTTHVIPPLPWNYNAIPQPYALFLVVGSPVAGTKVSRRNLVGNSSFESGITDWIRSGMAAGNTTLDAPAGANLNSYLATYSTATSILRKGTGSNGPQGPAYDGRTYTASVWVKCNNARQAGVTIMWLGQDQSINTTGAYGTLTTLVPNTWTRVSWTGTAPAGTRWVGPEAKIDGCLAGDQFWFDGYMIEEGSTLGSYFDGYTPKSGDLEHYFVGAYDIYQSVQVQPIPASKVWSFEGGVWVDRSGAVMKAWNGTTWVTKRPKYWNGTAWVAL